MPRPHNIFTHMHTYHMITRLHNYMHTQRFIWGECGQGGEGGHLPPLSESPSPLRICKYYVRLVMPPQTFPHRWSETSASGSIRAQQSYP